MAAKLYQFLGSPFCAKVRKLLEFKGVDFEVVEVDYLERKELLIASGQMTVPAVTFASGETIVDSARIAMRLEEMHPEPTIFPPGWRGLHLALADYIDNRLEESVYPAALADELKYYGSQGADRAALWRLIRERKYGAGFVERTIADETANWNRACAALAPFEEQLASRPFLTGRIGLADFSLYGQLYYFAFTGELKIPAELKNLIGFFGRVERISSRLDPAA
ncbi:MAG: glutathione S-transferase family protein [Candidatus Binatus sp.]|uniref:glutathione S-transferase family protein n=1 Tax=Candidatus Binatus sp. TaxID=2811406 RepID=UPI002727B58D|nr:glutathione S-transferase family protein [Candidatus Binatus sp.]MDO8434411.1 glutathione S-transferase family protein [Candidatus Binatus sp.]